MTPEVAMLLNFALIAFGLILVSIGMKYPFFGVVGVICLLLAVPAKDCLNETECLFTSPDLTLRNIAIVCVILIVTIVVILLMLTLMGKQWTKAMSPREPRTLQEKIDQVIPGSCFVYPNGRGGWREYRKNEDSTVTPGKTHKTKDDVPDVYNL